VLCKIFVSLSFAKTLSPVISARYSKETKGGSQLGHLVSCQMRGYDGRLLLGCKPAIKRSALEVRIKL